MTTVQDLQTILSRHKSRLFNKYPLKSMAIFGSYTRNEQTQESDVDILVDFKEKIGIRFIDLADEIEQIIGIKVDVVSKNGIKEKYLKSIDSDLIYV